MRVRNTETGETYFSKRRRAGALTPGPHELTFSCYRKFQFLGRDRTREWFVEALQQGRKKWPVDLWAWVIMPDHVHLIVSVRQPEVSVGRFRGFVKEQVARQAVAWLEEHAPQWIPKISVKEGNVVRRRFWQPGGGYDRRIEELKTLYSMIDYVHLNPVRRGLVERAEEWEWSSARWYTGLPSRLEMDRTLPSLDNDS